MPVPPEEPQKSALPVEISRFDPASATDIAMAELHAVVTAVMALDHPGQPMPTLPEFAALVRQPQAAQGPMWRWVARHDGRIVGQATATRPEHENRHLTIVRVVVTPDLRRRGIGTGLLRAVVAELSGGDRTLIMGRGVKADASGELWAKQLGFVRKHGYVRQIMTVAEVDPALWEHPVPEGFRLERWLGAAPEALLAEYARARTAITDAPQGESTLEFQDWTPQRVRTHEAELSERGIANRVVVCVHEASGRIAGLTEIGVRDTQPGDAFQLDTAVAAEFRGHGLGLAVKGAMMRWLVAERPGVQHVYTQTAHDNGHMIRINHALGYATTATLAELEAGTAELAKRLEV